MLGPGMVWGWSNQGGLETPEGTVVPAPAGRVAAVVCGSARGMVRREAGSLRGPVEVLARHGGGWKELGPALL